MESKGLEGISLSGQQRLLHGEGIENPARAARLVQTWMMVVPVLGGLPLGKSLLAGRTITADLLLGIGNILLIAVASVALGLGVALLNPAFSACWWTE